MLPLFRKTCLSGRVPPPPEGRFAIVTSVGGGMRWTRCAQRRSADRVRRNRAVPIPRCWNQALRAMRKATVANRQGTPRRPRISRQPIAQGTPVVSAALLMLACAKCTFLCTQGSRVRPASGIPCALHSLGGTRSMHSSGTSAARLWSRAFSCLKIESGFLKTLSCRAGTQCHSHMSIYAGTIPRQ